MVLDWMTGCVVKIGDSIHVKGMYDGYGNVEVAVEGKDTPIMAIPECSYSGGGEPDDVLATDIYCNGDGRTEDSTKGKKNKGKKAKKPASFGEVMSTLANGLENGTVSGKEEKELLRQLAQMQSNELSGMMAAYRGGVASNGDDDGDEEEELRFCVPKNVEVLDALPESLLATLPTVATQNKERKAVKGASKGKETERDSKKKAAVAAK